MARFNHAANPTKTINLAGGEAYSQSPELELVSILLTSFVQDQYYQKADDTVDRVRELLGKVDPKFAAKAAIYARTELGMRSISHVVAGEIAERVKGENWTRRFYDRVIKRPDDMGEILGYYRSKGNKNEPNALKRGFAQAFSRFDMYQLAKYKGEGKEFSLIDVANLVHPIHTDAVAALINGSLAPANTWETKLTQAGQKAENDEQKEQLKAEAWASLISENKLGYFALLRNLRNIMEQAPEVLPEALKMLTDEKRIKKSMVLPFRFFTAYKEFTDIGSPAARSVVQALATALDISVSNMPEFGDDTLVVVDHSGSMDSIMSDHSKATRFHIGALFGIALAKKCNADFMYFGDTATYHNISSDSIIGQLNLLEGLNSGWYDNGPGYVGHGTNFNAIFEEATRAYTRIFIFSDMQGWVNHTTPQGVFSDYKRRTGANPKVYSFDLAGYGTMQFPENGVVAIAGFSDKILDVIKLLEQDRRALVKKIDEIEL